MPLIESLVERWFTHIHTTPNILTEVSNLGKKAGEEFYPILGEIINSLEEMLLASKDAVRSPLYGQCGLTDAGLYALGSEHLVVTADFALYVSLRHKGIDAVNFNHVRTAAWAGFRHR